MQMILESLWLAMKAAQNVISATPSIGIDNGSGTSLAEGKALPAAAQQHLVLTGTSEKISSSGHTLSAVIQQVAARSNSCSKSSENALSRRHALNGSVYDGANYPDGIRRNVRELVSPASATPIHDRHAIEVVEMQVVKCCANSSCPKSCCSNPRAVSLPFGRVSSLISASMKRLMADVAMHDWFAAVAR
jgi:hypothetical protein